jgi:hypothetical protein
MAGRRRRLGPPIHLSIRNALGYEHSASDDEVYADWKERKSRVCKPCWELKYCPYGPLVEQSPTLPSLKDGSEQHNAYLEECLKTGLVGTVSPLTLEKRKRYEKWSKDDEVLRRQAWFTLSQRMDLKAAAGEETEDEQIAAWIGDGLPPIHVYRTPFRQDVGDLNEDDFTPETWREILRIAEEKRARYIQSLVTGEDDDRAPLEPARRAWFKRMVEDFSPDDHPEIIPETFTEAECNVYGHVCPVFFAAEAITETEEERRIGRRRISFSTMMRIVRRDNYQCQHCHTQLHDNEVEFDHIIPVSKGGSSEEHNLRLTCFKCNRDKSDDYAP